MCYWLPKWDPNVSVVEELYSKWFITFCKWNSYHFNTTLYPTLQNPHNNVEGKKISLRRQSRMTLHFSSDESVSLTCWRKWILTAPFCHCYATPFFEWRWKIWHYTTTSVSFLSSSSFTKKEHRTMAKPLPNSLRSGDAAAISASFLLVKILFVFVGTGEHTDARHFFPNYHFWHKNATTCKKYKNISHFSTKKILLLVLLLKHILVELWSLFCEWRGFRRNTITRQSQIC